MRAGGRSARVQVESRPAAATTVGFGMSEVLAGTSSAGFVLGVVIAAVSWLFFVAHSAPGGAWPTGTEARCYWFPSLADPYRLSEWTNQVAYVYSPAFLQLIAPLKVLPWATFMGAWTALLMAVVLVLSGPRLFWLGLLAAWFELFGGNISLLLALAIVLGFRWPAAWAFVLLTKITPGVGLLWFAIRREWRNLGLALGATAVVVVVSALLQPEAWLDWIRVLSSNAGRDGTWAAVPVPLWLRLPVAIAVVAWGATTNRRWTVPVASMLALPALWYGSLSMLIALLALRSWPEEQHDDTDPPPPQGRRGRHRAPAVALLASSSGPLRHQPVGIWGVVTRLASSLGIWVGR